VFIPYFSLFLHPFLFIVYFCMYAFFSIDTTILVNKDVYIKLRTLNYAGLFYIKNSLYFSAVASVLLVVHNNV